MIKKIIKNILRKLSRVIYFILPEELTTTKELRLSVFQLHRKKEILECFNHFEKHLQKAIHSKSHHDIRKYAIERSLLNDKEKNKFYLEFGVYVGTSINFFSDYVKTIYGFDSFEGLKEDWTGHFHPKGTYNLNKKIPKLKNNVVPVVGWAQDTLEDFLKKHNPKINFVHMDFDTYETSLYVLKSIKPYLDKNAIILFDQLYNFVGWRNGEYKALQETFDENEYKFRAFTINAQQAVIQLN